MFTHFLPYVPSCFYHLILKLLGTLVIVSLSFFLSLPVTLVASWHLNVSSFCPETLFVPGHLLIFLLHLIVLPLMSSSVMRRPNQTSLRTFHNMTFIRNTKSFCQISLTLTCPLLSTVEVESHYVAPQSRAHLWSYRSSTPKCTEFITLYLSFLVTFEVYTW